MTRPAATSLDYAAPGRRRWPWRLLIVAALALSLGIATRLCWAKFAPAVRSHFQALAAQREMETAIAPATITIEAVASSQWHPVAGGPTSDDGAVTAFLNANGEFPGPHNGLLWAGRLSTAAGQPRIVVVLVRRLLLTQLEPDVALTAYVFSEGSFLRPSRLVTPVVALDLGVSVPATLGPTRRMADVPSQLIVDVTVNGRTRQAILTLRADDTLVLDAIR